MTVPSTNPSGAERAITWDEAEKASLLSEQRFTTGDVDGIVSKYDDDIVIRFTSLPEIRGKDAARRFVEKRLARQIEYKPKKKVLAVDGQRVTRSWTGTWIDAHTKKNMEGKGIEFLEYRDGKLILWESVFNTWEIGKREETEYFDPV